MVRNNHKKDLDLYRKIFNVYVGLMQELSQKTDFEIEDVKDEKKYCRPKAYGKFDRNYLAAFDRSNIKNEPVKISVAGFSCSFKLMEVITYKRLIERKLITPKHHLFYVDVMGQSKKVA